MEFVDADGLRIAYRRSGSGPPVFLLHGAVSDSRAWRVELDTLADQFTVVAWDAPGCGASSDPPESYRLAEYADALASLIEALGLEPVRLVGHSWGTGLALELYRRRPELAAAMVLAGAYAGWAGSLSREEVEGRLHMALHADPASMPGLLSDAIPDDRAKELARIMAAARPPTTRTMAHSFAEADLRDVLAHITVPVLILAGDADERSPLSVARAIHTSIADSRLVVLPGLGQEMFFEDSATCGDIVRAFLHEVGP